jgi:hypothetical protein
LEVISMSSRLFAGAGALAIILAAGHALAADQDQRFRPVGKPQKAATIPRPAPLGATVDSVLAVGRQLNPALRAAALDTSTAAAKAAGADALDDPMIRPGGQITGQDVARRLISRREPPGRWSEALVPRTSDAKVVNDFEA